MCSGLLAMQIYPNSVEKYEDRFSVALTSVPSKKTKNVIAVDILSLRFSLRVFWVLVPYSVVVRYHASGDLTVFIVTILRNFDILPQQYTVSQPRKPRSDLKSPTNHLTKSKRSSEFVHIINYSNLAQSKDNFTFTLTFMCLADDVTYNSML